MHIGKRDKESAECLLAKYPEDLKKKLSFIRISSQSILKSLPGSNTAPLRKSLAKQAIERDVITPLDKEALGL